MLGVLFQSVKFGVFAAIFRNCRGNTKDRSAPGLAGLALQTFGLLRLQKLLGMSQFFVV